jgi:hypothetical protein
LIQDLASVLCNEVEKREQRVRRSLWVGVLVVLATIGVACVPAPSLSCVSHTEFQYQFDGSQVGDGIVFPPVDGKYKTVTYLTSTSEAQLFYEYNLDIAGLQPAVSGAAHNWAIEHVGFGLPYASTWFSDISLAPDGLSVEVWFDFENAPTSLPSGCDVEPPYASMEAYGDAVEDVFDGVLAGSQEPDGSAVFFTGENAQSFTATVHRYELGAPDPAP